MEWLRGTWRLYVYRDAAGEPRAFYLDEELLREPPWWAEERSGVDAGAEEVRRELREPLDRLSS